MMKSGNTAPFGVPGRQFPASVVIALLNGEGVKSSASPELRRSVDELIHFLCRSEPVSREAACEEAFRQFPVLRRIYVEGVQSGLIGWEVVRARILAVIEIEMKHLIDPVTRVIFFQVPTAASPVKPSEQK